LQAGVDSNVCKKVGQWQLHRPQRISRFQSLAFIAVMEPAFVLEFDVLAKREFSIGVTLPAPSRNAPRREYVDVLLRLSRALNFRQRASYQQITASTRRAFAPPPL
jgi:hypothetical protein